MDDLHLWIKTRLNELPPREHVVIWDHSSIEFNTVTLQGKIRLTIAARKPDTIICYNILTDKYGRIICSRIYEMLTDDGVILIVCKDIHPGIVRFWLKPFEWKYITATPINGEVYAIAGKGEKYYEQTKDFGSHRQLRRVCNV